MAMINLQHLRDHDGLMWRRPQVRAWLNTLSDERLAADQAAIDGVLARAQKSPLAMRALEWAQAHDIGIILDRQAKGAGAYYLPGAGVAAILPAYLGNKNYFDVVSLVHEIRHAWQDMQGLLPSWKQDRFMAQGNVVSSILQSAVLEADAHAHDRAVMRECLGGATTVDDLRADFANWYQAKGAFYTGLERDKHAAVLQIGDAAYPDFNIEVAPQETLLRRIGVQAERGEDIVRLGKSFNGKNYLAGWFGDAVARRLHATDTVVRAFNATSPRDGVIEAVMKKQIANRLAVPDVARRLPG